MEFILPILVNSDSNQNAKNVSLDGSTFTIYYDDPLLIPDNATKCFLAVQESTIWNVVFNVNTGVNDAFKLTYFDGSLSVEYDIIFPAGLYDISSLNSTLDRLLINEGAPSNLLTLSGNSANNKSIITNNVLTPETIEIDFTIDNCIRTILGFDSQTIAASSGIISYESDSIASFNNIDHFLIHSDIVGKGLLINNKYSQVIAQVNIDSPPGDQIIYRPFHELYIPCNEIIGRKISNSNFWLTDNNNNKVNTNGEIFTIRFALHYVTDKEENELLKIMHSIKDLLFRSLKKLNLV
jgi:hypothetical protein